MKTIDQLKKMTIAEIRFYAQNQQHEICGETRFSRNQWAEMIHRLDNEKQISPMMSIR